MRAFSWLGVFFIILAGSDYFFHWLLPRNEKGAYFILNHWVGIGTIQLMAVVIGAVMLMVGLMYGVRRKS